MAPGGFGKRSLLHTSEDVGDLADHCCFLLLWQAGQDLAELYAGLEIHDNPSKSTVNSGIPCENSRQDRDDLRLSGSEQPTSCKLDGGDFILGAIFVHEAVGLVVAETNDKVRDISTRLDGAGLRARK